jgi:hydrogenase maturation protease
LTDARPIGQPQTLVLGFGNPLWSDDGAGIAAVTLLARQVLPPGVRVEAAGLPGYGLAAWLQEASQPDPSLPSGQRLQRLILIDAARMEQAPGTWRRFTPDQVRLIANGAVVSLHQADLSNGLALAQALDILPEEVLFYGIEPERLQEGLELSPTVRATLPQMVDDILVELWNGREKNEQ